LRLPANKPFGFYWSNRNFEGDVVISQGQPTESFEKGCMMYIYSDRPEQMKYSSFNLSSAPSAECKMIELPRGKGMVIVSLPKLDTVVERVSDAGLSWLAISHVSHKDSKGRLLNRNRVINSSRDIKDCVDKLRSDVDKDFGIWIYGGHPNPQRKKEFISALVDTAVLVGARGVIANPEAPWLTAGGRREGKNFMDSLLDQAHKNCLSVGITTYRDVKRNVPWMQFSRADFGLPQIYTATPKEAAKAIQDWKDKGFEVVIPLLSTAKKYKPSESAKAMQKTYDNIPILDCAVAWWSWANTTSEERWKVIKNAVMPVNCRSSRLPADYSCVMPQLGGFGLGGTAQFCIRVPIATNPTPCRFYM
jgi:hypothetical protein